MNEINQTTGNIKGLREGSFEIKGKSEKLQNGGTVSKESIFCTKIWAGVEGGGGVFVFTVYIHMYMKL